MKAVFVSEFGGVDKLRYEELPNPALQAGQALVKIAASGVNFIDIYFRTGLYPAPAPVEMPSTCKRCRAAERKLRAPGDVAWSRAPASAIALLHMGASTVANG